jgi:hypothetical protein
MSSRGGPRAVAHRSCTLTTNNTGVLSKEDLIKTGNIAVKNVAEVKKYLEQAGIYIDDYSTTEPLMLNRIATHMFTAAQDKGTCLLNYLCTFAFIIEALTEQQVAHRVAEKVSERLDTIITCINSDL